MLAAGAVFVLYRTTTRELAEQSRRAVEEEGRKYAAELESHLRRSELAVLVELASFHTDGLARRLNQWDQSNELVLAAELWGAGQDAAHDSAQAIGAGRRELVLQARETFRRWRAEHPGETTTVFRIGRYHLQGYRTFESAAFAEVELGFQAENLDNVRHAGRRVDPWALRVSDVETPRAPWIVWYEMGPAEDTRVCLIDAARILDGAPAVGDGQLVMLRAEVGANAGRGTAAERRTFPLNGFPGVWVVGEPGGVLVERASALRLTALFAGGVLAVFAALAFTLGQASRRASAEAERKITFVSQVSHELRTPLTSIQMLADLLRTPALPDDKRVRFAGTVAEETTRLRGLIEKLLTFNRLQQGKQPILRTAVALPLLVEAAVEQMREPLAAAGLRTELSLAEELPAAEADETLLKQALLNLLENAAKHASGATQVEVRLHLPRPGWTAIDIVDDGCGVPAALRDRVFEPFVQGSDGSTSKTPGFGLGLSIARETLRQFGGKVELIPSRRGAHFRITLPVARSAGSIS